MPLKFKRYRRMVICSVLLIGLPAMGHAYVTNQAADIVIGQTDMTTSTSGVAANKFSLPIHACSDNGKFYVTDHGANRVLIYHSVPTQNNASADVVVGQTNMTSNNTGLLFNPFCIRVVSGKLMVADFRHNRIVVLNGIPSSNTVSGDYAVGQINLNLNQVGSGIGPNRLYQPQHLFSDGTKLFVADTWNHRVLIFNSIPTTHNAYADVVVGQANLSANIAGASSNRLYWPTSVFVHSGKLIISDTGNHRVLIFNSIPNTHNASADVVLGQPDFGTVTAGCSSVKLNTPEDLFVDSAARLFISDLNNHRVLGYHSIPTANGAPADVVIGQANMTQNAAGCSATRFNVPRGIGGDETRLFVSDYGNNRVLVFKDTCALQAVSPTSGVINQPITLDLTGNGFAQDMSVVMTMGSVSLAAAQVQVMDSAHAVCRFELNIYPGEYTISIARPILGTAAWTGKFTVFAAVATTNPVFRSDLRILRNQINPDRGDQALIQWDQVQPGDVRITIYSLAGEKIVMLVDEKNHSAGQGFETRWNGRLANGRIAGSGIYIVWARIGEQESRGKIAVVR